MDSENFTLLFSGLINLFMSIFVISRGWKNKINLYFSLLTLSTFFWSLSLFLSRMINSGSWLFWSRFAYVSAIFIAVSLFYFVYFFPFVLNKIKRITHFLILIPAILIIIVIYFNNLFILDYIIDINVHVNRYTLYFYEPVYLLYSIYFVLVVLSAIIHLINKYRLSELVFKRQIIILLISIVIGLLFGIYFDLILCYFGNFKYNWFGPLFTFFMNIAVFYFIVSSKEKIHA